MATHAHPLILVLTTHAHPLILVRATHAADGKVQNAGASPECTFTTKQTVGMLQKVQKKNGWLGGHVHKHQWATVRILLAAKTLGHDRGACARHQLVHTHVLYAEVATFGVGRSDDAVKRIYVWCAPLQGVQPRWRHRSGSA